MNHYLGIDTGSVSINFAVINEKKKIEETLYLRNRGVIETIQEGFKLLKHKKINGVGITGSGRTLTNALIGGDLVKTEILAHSIATTHFYPEVNTIFEIGGEDSKLMIIKDKVLVGYSMNNMCLTENNLITMDNYVPKKINDVSIGEKILTHKGNITKIKKVYKRDYNGELMNIECTNLRCLEITPEHPILALKRENIKCYNSRSRNNTTICKPNKNCVGCKKNISFIPNFIKSNELKKGDLMAIPIPSMIVNHRSISYDKIKSEKDRQILKEVGNFNFKQDCLRLLGYFLAEGSFAYCRSRGKTKKKCLIGIKFTFNSKENKYIDDVTTILKNNFDVSLKQSHQGSTTHVIAYNKSLAKIIKYLCNEKSHSKFMSKELMQLSPKLQLEIIKGLFRGDGCFANKINNNRKKRSYTLRIISKDLAHQVHWILLRNKINCGIFLERNKKKFDVYNIGVYGSEINKLNDEEFYIEDIKKISSYSFIYDKWLFVPIQRISSTNFRGKVYNLEIEGDNSYTANFLSVHNCGGGTGAMIENIANRMGLQIEKVGDLALKHKSEINLPGKCGIFCQSAVVSYLNSGTSKEDLLWGVCRALISNYLFMLSQGKELKPPYVFQGGVALNKAVIGALEQELGHKVMVPKYSPVMGAIGMALLAGEAKIKKSNFKGFDINATKFKIARDYCDDCSNSCEILEVKENKILISAWGSKCGKRNK